MFASSYKNVRTISTNRFH